MLDENLPTFIFRPMPDHPSSAVVYYTRSGSDPAPEYVLRIADPVSTPACRGVYAAALADPYNSTDVVYGEVAVTPEWVPPTLSAAELREHREKGTEAAGARPTPRTPDTLPISLYNPDQAVAVRHTPGSWNRTEAWEFELPVEAFRAPSASRLDRQAPGAAGAAGAASTAAGVPAAVSLAPKNTFRWKRDGRLGNKDMTCYMVGQTVGLHRSKEPDITVALFKHGRDPAVTIYEPNLQRVDVQDRKGLDLVLLLSAQAIRDLFLVPRPDPFNMEGGAAAVAGGARRKNSRPPAPPPTMTAALAVSGATPSATPSAAAIDAETKRLQAMLAREEAERLRREQDEEKRIKQMLEAEARAQQLRDAEVAKETERLRRLYGVAGQELPSSGRPVPPVPPVPVPASSHNAYVPQRYPAIYETQQYLQHPPLPARPVSAGPSGRTSRWRASSGGSHKKTGGFLSSGLFSSGGGGGGGGDDERSRIQKKRSVHF